MRYFIESPLSSSVCYKYLFMPAGLQAGAALKLSEVRNQTEVHIINIHQDGAGLYEYSLLTYRDRLCTFDPTAKKTAVHMLTISLDCCAFVFTMFYHLGFCICKEINRSREETLIQKFKNFECFLKRQS